MFAAGWPPVSARAERRGRPRTVQRRRRLHRPDTAPGGPRRSCRPRTGSSETSWSRRFDTRLPKPRPARRGRLPPPSAAAPAQAASAGSPSPVERTPLRRQNPDGIPFGLEDDRLDVTQVLAVHLERQRAIAANLDPLEIVAVDDVLRVLAAATERVAKQARDPHRPDAPRRNQVE